MVLAWLVLLLLYEVFRYLSFVRRRSLRTAPFRVSTASRHYADEVAALAHYRLIRSLFLDRRDLVRHVSLFFCRDHGSGLDGLSRAMVQDCVAAYLSKVVPAGPGLVRELYTAEVWHEAGDIVDELEKRICVTFVDEGQSALAVRPAPFIFIGERPLHAYWRPLPVHLLLVLADVVARALLLCAGFRRSMCAYSGILFWTRSRSSEETPLLFLPGVFGGATFYVPWVLRLAATSRSIVIAELPGLQGVIDASGLSPLSSDAIADSLDAHRMRCFGSTSWNVVAHSYGTAVLTYLLRSPHGRKLHRVVAIDPASFIPCFPDIACKAYASNLASFTTLPGSLASKLLTAIVFGDLAVQFVTKRATTCWEMLLTDDDIAANRSKLLVVLSEKDRFLGDSSELCTYLNERKVNVVVLPGVHHGAIVHRAAIARCAAAHVHAFLS